MLILQILVGIGVLLLWLIFARLNEIGKLVMTLVHQLEYLGAPLELGDNGLVVAKRPPDSPEYEIRKRMVRD